MLFELRNASSTSGGDLEDCGGTEGLYEAVNIRLRDAGVGPTSRIHAPPARRERGR